MNQFLIFFALVAIFSPSFSYAEEKKEYTKEEYWELIAKRPDVTLTTAKNQMTGEDIKVAKFKGGVDIYSDGLEIDHSGLGAIRCVRELMVYVPVIIKKCATDKLSKEENDLMVKDLENLIKKIDIFYAENSILPITLQEVEEDTQKRTAKAEEEMTCNDGFAKHLIGSLSDDKKKGLMKKMMKEMERTTSVPRPPVRNPCL